jgi:hypothetical protein
VFARPKGDPVESRRTVRPGSRRPRRGAAVLTALGLLLAACGDSATTTTAPTGIGDLGESIGRSAETTTTTTTTLPAPGDELDPDGPPTFGTHSARAGFPDDPLRYPMRVAGPIDVSYLGEECVGYTAVAPDLRFVWEGSGTLLRFFFLADTGDAVLAIRAPDGSWHCDDDSFGTLDPTVDFVTGASGRYDVWVGSYSRGRTIEGTLHVTELADMNPARGEAGEALDVALSPTFGTFELAAGFLPDPRAESVVSGGSVAVRYLGGGCTGYAAVAPDLRLQWDGAGTLLRFFFIPDEDGDTTLVINAPDGSWHCNDDSFGTLNPTVDFDTGPSGTYDVWVGSYIQGEFVAGTLYVTELESERP